MTQPGFRFTIGRLMALIAAVAVALALWPTPIGPLALLFLALGGVAAVLVRMRGMNRVRGAAWVFSAYPVLLFGLALLTHVVSAEVGNRLVTTFTLGMLPALWISWGCAIAEWVRATTGGQDRTRSVAGLLVFALLSWPIIVVLGSLILATLGLPFFDD